LGTSVASHNLLSASHPDTTAATVVAGDLIYGYDDGYGAKWTRLPAGSTGTIPFMNGTVPTWSSSPGLVWDSANNRLGVNIVTPGADLDIGMGSTPTTQAKIGLGTTDANSLRTIAM